MYEQVLEMEKKLDQAKRQLVHMILASPVPGYRVGGREGGMGGVKWLSCGALLGLGLCTYRYIFVHYTRGLVLIT